MMTFRYQQYEETTLFGDEIKELHIKAADIDNEVGDQRNRVALLDQANIIETGTSSNLLFLLGFVILIGLSGFYLGKKYFYRKGQSDSTVRESLLSQQLPQ